MGDGGVAARGEGGGSEGARLFRGLQVPQLVGILSPVWLKQQQQQTRGDSEWTGAGTSAFHWGRCGTNPGPSPLRRANPNPNPGQVHCELLCFQKNPAPDHGLIQILVCSRPWAAGTQPSIKASQNRARSSQDMSPTSRLRG